MRGNRQRQVVRAVARYRRVFVHFVATLPAMLRTMWRSAVHLAAAGVAVLAAVAVFVLELTQAIIAIALLAPQLHREYRRFRPKGFTNKYRTVVRIVRLTSKHKLQPVYQRFSHRLAVIFPHARGCKRQPAQGKAFMQRTWRAGAVVGIVAIAIINILLPALQVRASSLTWSSDGDFTNNKIGKCQTTTVNNVVISGSGYNDPTCAAAGTDASMSLRESGALLTNVTAIAAGGSHSLALKTDGTVWAWGYNAQGQLGDGTTTSRYLPVQTKDSAGTGYLTGVSSIAAGSSHSLALKTDGTVWAWGSNGNGQLGDGTTTQRTLPVQTKDSAGTGYLTGVSSIAAGSSYSLALKTDGTVWAWGRNAYGQLGDGTTTQRNLPVQAKDAAGTGYLTGVAAIAASGPNIHSLALKTDGTVWAWGYNAYGQLGDGTTTQRTLPIQTKDTTGTGYLTGVVAISANSFNSVALKQDGTVWAWGLNQFGALGDGTTTQRNLPVQTKDSTGTGFLTSVAAISSFGQSPLAIKQDGTVWAWGDNTNGQLGDGTTTNRYLPVQTKDPTGTGYLTGVLAIAAGYEHSLALKQDGTVWAWGKNASGQAGVAEEPVRSATRKLPGGVLANYSSSVLTDVIAVSAGDNYSLALKTDGTVWAWGYNTSGQLGDGTTTNRSLPVQTKDPTGTGFLIGVSAIATGYSHSLALKTDGTVWAWGSNSYGQLGDGTTTQRSLPVQTKDPAGTGFLTGVSAISAGGNHSLALKTDGTVWAWGYNTSGQLGDSTTTQRSLPVQTKDPTGTGYLTEVASITTSSFHSLALKTDGTVWAWGINAQGQLGDGTTTQRTLPVQTKDPTGTGYLTGVAAISAGGQYTHSLALKTDGTVWAWGSNSYGQLGDGTTTNRSLPVQTKDPAGTGYLTGVTTIAAGSSHSLALKTDGTVWAWGGNTQSQLGDWSNINRSLPVQTLEAVNFVGGYAPAGTASGYVVDAGDKRRAKWHSVAWNTEPLPAETAVVLSARTSQDGTTWSAWTDSTQNTTGSTTQTADLSLLPAARYLELKATLRALGSMVNTPTLHDFTLQMLTDITPPATNASDIHMYRTNTLGGEVADAGWNNSPTPYFTWQGATDNPGGAGIAGYCLYLGQDNTADVTQTKGGYLGNSPLNSNGLCQYAVSGTSLDLSAGGVLATALPTSDQPYYLLAKAFDTSNNLYDGAAEAFAFKQDVVAPTNVQFVSLPGQFVSTKDVTMVWPTSGGQAAADANSGLAGLQYRIGATGTWYGTAHNGKQDITDVLPGAGTYQTDPTYDYPLLNDGNNMIYFRSIDAAGNVSETVTTAVIKLNTASPGSPQNLVAVPATNTANNFAFSWAAPATYVGQATGITYCYTVNTLPTDTTCTYTAAGQTSLAAGAYATQPGANTLYVAARDEAGNINFATAASVSFTANTAAPGIPLNMEIADVSVKATASWKLALSWERPTDAGAGVANYRVLRSTTGPDSGYTQIATTQGNSYVDTNLNAVNYYYKVKACDSANNCGAETAPVTKLPTGRFTVAAEIIGTPSVQVSTRKATIRWTTERNSDSRIQYGTTSGTYLPGEVTYSEQTKVHSVELTGLEAGKTYYYKAKWTDEDGNIGKSSEMMFTTLPAPAIKDVTIIKKSLNSAVVQFTSTDAVNVKINFGKSPMLGGLKVINTSVAESTYTVELDGLDDGTTYYLRPDGTDTDGFTYEGNALSFSTPPRPRITNLRFQPIAGEPTSTQKVTWQTNVPTSSMVTYGLDATNGTDSLDSKLVTEHAVIVKDLKDNSNYFLLAQSRDADGNLAVSDRQTFRTALDTRPPKISDVNVEASVKGTGADARGQIVVTWKTDEPTTSQVVYGQGSGSNGSYTNSTVDDTRLKTEHTVVVSDLRASSVYYLQPITRDGANNLTKGDEQSAIIGRPTDNVMTIILNALYRTFGL